MRQLTGLDDRISRFLQRWSITLLRLSVGVVFIWFGALKVFDVTPVADLVADTVYWVDPDWFVPFLGAFEIVVGVGLIAGRAQPAAQEFAEVEFDILEGDQLQPVGQEIRFEVTEQHESTIVSSGLQ